VPGDLRRVAVGLLPVHEEAALVGHHRVLRENVRGDHHRVEVVLVGRLLVRVGAVLVGHLPVYVEEVRVDAVLHGVDEFLVSACESHEPNRRGLLLHEVAPVVDDLHDLPVDGEGVLPGRLSAVVLDDRHRVREKVVPVVGRLESREEVVPGDHPVHRPVVVLVCQHHPRQTKMSRKLPMGGEVRMHPRSTIVVDCLVSTLKVSSLLLHERTLTARC